MTKFIATLIAAGTLAVAGTAASAITVNPGGQVGIQITGGYSTTDGLSIREGSVLTIEQFSSPLGSADPFVSSIGSVGPVDLEGLALNDLTLAFIGDTITVDGTTAPAFDFSIDTADVDPVFVATSKVLTTNTVIPVGSGDDTVLEGLGLLDDQLGSWSFSISGDNASGSFTLFLSVPPEIVPVDPIPLPAGAPLLLGALGALAYLRRKAA